MIGIRSRRSLRKSTISKIREFLVIWLSIFERKGRASTSSRLKCLVLCITAEARRFWGINNIIFTLGFSFSGVLQFLVAGKVNFDAEKVANLPTAKYRFVHHCTICGYRTAVNISRLSIVSCLQGELCRSYRRVCRAI